MSIQALLLDPFFPCFAQGIKSSEKTAEKVQVTDLERDRRKRTVFIALSSLMVLGLLLSLYLGLPWPLALGFFVLSLTPLFPVWKVNNSKLFFDAFN